MARRVERSRIAITSVCIVPTMLGGSRRRRTGGPARAPEAVGTTLSRAKALV